MIKLKRLRSADVGFAAQFAEVLSLGEMRDAALETVVSDILNDVKARGDVALLEYTRRFDAVSIDSMAALELSKERLQQALQGLPLSQRTALEQAAARIRTYHEKQPLQSWEYAEPDGTRLGQKVTPLERVGIYVPGGKAAYPSSVMMNAIPAKVAGVTELIMTVPAPRGVLNEMVLAAAALCGVDRVFTVGGAQAIGALAYGTQLIPRVDKIVGPGNAYVAAAKRQVFGTVGIDMVAGPSEILVISDGTAPADWIAMDLFSQAEHDEMAQAILLSPSASFIDEVAASMERQLADMSRRDVIRAALERRGALIEVRDLDEACAIANRIAPEHLELAVRNPERLLPSLHNAGAIFMGVHASEALGDYCAGPNHVLPTSGTARFSSPLGVYDFQKRTSIIAVSEEGASRLGHIAVELARGEGLPAHAQSALYRIK